MAQYLMEIAYTPEAWATLVRHPQNRIEGVRPAVEALGGTLVGGGYAFGDSDIIVIVDMPDNVSAAALSLAFAAGGAVRKSKTTPLIAPEDAMEAMRKAGNSVYKPPS